MKYISILFFLHVCVAQGLSQTPEPAASPSVNFQMQSTSVSVNITILTPNFEPARNELNKWIFDQHVLINNQSEDKFRMEAEIQLSEANYQQLELLLPGLGYVQSKNVNKTDNTAYALQNQMEIEHLKHRKEEVLAVMSNYDKTSTDYRQFWNQLQQLEEEIFQKEKAQVGYTTNPTPYKVNITLMDEVSTAMENNSKVSFVNMPGVEYSSLNIEEPNDTVSASMYQGYFLKYNFTKGKSYASLGAYKSTQPSQDSMQYNELFIYSFGQDFYSRHLGRGGRKYLNLYSGYTVGGIIASNEFRKKDIFYISPAVGLEIFKNKYLLIDSKVNYFLPFTYNRNLRGLAYNFSVNFVF